ncbi:hypothetical protein M378DRAFT_635382 [Amanita muscaria Koide BX008]|uniref:Uncharacterized protein n=1 Tax=Amanita muscaria (strain Koide BX008) TaxID=946122 RepID=A0A0C2X5V1_AMAMK|nr:hypothetical protein M378DRAFT_635382 [Amanita muscaria Koide BX008]
MCRKSSCLACKENGDVNDGDTDPGTDTDNDTDVEDENKENVNTGCSVPRVQSPIACLPDRTAEPQPKTPISTCRPSAYRATVEEAIDDEERILISARTQASTTEGIFATPRKPANHGEHVFPGVQSWHEPRPTESVFGSPSKSTSETIQLSADTGASLSSAEINARRSWQEQQQTQLPQPRSSFPSAGGSCTSQEQRPAGPSLDAFSSTNAQRQQTSESHQSYFTDRAQPTNIQQPCFSFPASQASYLLFPSGNDTQPTAASQPMSQSVFPLPNAQPSMPQAFFNSVPEISQQPQLFAQNTPSGFQQQAAFNWTFQQPATQSMPSFQNSQTTSSHQPNAFQAQSSNSTGFPTLEATFAFFSIPPTASRPIIRRLPVLAPDDPPNRPILFGPHGIQAFLKERPIPVEEDAPLPLEPLDNFNCDAWNEKIRRRCEAFQARQRKSGPLGKLPPSPKKNYVGKPPRGSEEDLIRRLVGIAEEI